MSQMGRYRVRQTHQIQKAHRFTGKIRSETSRLKNRQSDNKQNAGSLCIQSHKQRSGKASVGVCSLSSYADCRRGAGVIRNAEQV